MDIVERLRSIDISWSEHGEWCAEAADEIERLRQALRMWVKFWEADNIFNDDALLAEEAMEVTRELLGEE